jgi:hypothetical protein
LRVKGINSQPFFLARQAGKPLEREEQMEKIMRSSGKR